MKIINKIVISKFRSFGENVEIDCSDVNVFSGGNDSGKSNIIKALNLFFNQKTDNYTGYIPQDDFNKWFRANNVGGTRDISIKIHFDKGYYKDPEGINKGFIAERVYGTNGSITSHYYLEGEDRPLSPDTTSYKRADAVTRGTIKFVYIPAIRDSNFRRFIQGELIQITNGMKKLDKEFNSLREELNKTFTDFGGQIRDKININVVADVTFSTLLESLAFATDEQITIKKKGTGAITEKQPIPMTNRGDGIQMQFISFLLWFISAKDKSHKYIWGFEEPEVAYEFKKQFDMAEIFRDTFSKDAQVFITTHSPAFIMDKGTNIRQYRVYKEKDNVKNRELSYVKDIDKYVEDLFSRENEHQELLRREIWGTNYQKLAHGLGSILNETDGYKTISAALETSRRELKESQALSIQQKNKIKKNEELLKGIFPEKIFICEDESAVELWKNLFEKTGIADVKILSSLGSASNRIESAIEFKRTEKNGYNPKIFRQLDLDGYLPEQVRFLEEQMPNKFVKLSTYVVKFLPVNELENFAILAEPTFTDDYIKQDVDAYVKVRDACHDTARKNLLKIRNTFFEEIKLSVEENKIDKNLFNEQEQKMRDAATTNPLSLLPGKNIKKMKNLFSPEGKLKRLHVEDWPESLRLYLDSVKTFFEAP